jgi:hypothetical protein
MSRYTRDDVERCYHDTCRRSDVHCPHANVKVYRTFQDVRFPLEDAPEELTLEWIEQNVPEDDDSLFWRTCEAEWEMLQQDADEIFGSGVEVHAGGRSGGWACVTGLPDIDEWDAVMLAKWRRFEKYARAYAHGIPEQMVYSLAANEWEWDQERQAEEAGLNRDPMPA